MDILDMFDWENNSKKNHNEYGYNKSNKKHNKSEFWEMNISNIVGNLWNYKKFIPIIIIAGIVLIIIVVGAIILVLPYLKSLIGNIDQNWLQNVVESWKSFINNVEQNWIKSVVESWTSLLDKVWNWNSN